MAPGGKEGMKIKVKKPFLFNLSFLLKDLSVAFFTWFRPYIVRNVFIWLFCPKRLAFFHYFDLFATLWPRFLPEASLLQRTFRFLNHYNIFFFSKALIDSQNNNIKKRLEDISKTQRHLLIGEITILTFLPNNKIL